MSVLAGLGAKLFEILLSDLFAWASKYYQAYKKKKAIKDDIADKVQKLNDAQTGDDDEKAADDLLKRI